MTASSSFPVTQFQHPRLSVPLPILMSEPNTFAHYTLMQRWPAVVRRVIAENDFLPDVVERLDQLITELPDGEMRSLHDRDSPDAEAWDTYLQPYLEQSWLDVPWFFAEFYFYRRILEATHYFQPSPTQAVDPFASQKRAGLNQAMNATRAMSKVLADEGFEGDRLQFFLYAALWGNQADLSLNPSADPSAQDVEAQLKQDHILVNHVSAVGDWLSRGVQRIDIVADNAGLELISDLCLADLLLQKGVETIVLHLKAHPTFVSDATVEDVYFTLAALEADSDATVRSLERRLKHNIASDRLQLRDAWCWISPLVGWEMPTLLRHELHGTHLTIMKGDANYRRLLGDCHWTVTTRFEDIVCYFPTPVVALRTLKSEIVAGLSPGQVDWLNHHDSDWLVSGKWGLIQTAQMTN
ncbi:MAG: damage-control phosphatase ARMT1 family protein [Elainellaceae cyanobacterium]